VSGGFQAAIRPVAWHPPALLEAQLTGPPILVSIHAEVEGGLKPIHLRLLGMSAALVMALACSSNKVTGPGSLHDGTWRGTTAGGQTVGFVVAQNKITSLWFTVSASEPLNNIECTGKVECLEGQSCASHADSPVALGDDGSFAVTYGGATITGAFSSTAQVDGNLSYFIQYADPCTGVSVEGAVKWSAYKHKDSTGTTTLDANALALLGSWEVQYTNYKNCSNCRTGTAGWELLADGTLCSTGTSSYRASACSLAGANAGTWTLAETSFSGTIYSGFSTYTGAVTDGKTMQGTATNQNGATWDWNAEKRD
jgi:hypothetical protein